MQAQKVSVSVEMKSTVTKTGRAGEKILNQKEYGLKYGLKGAALKRAHYAYRKFASGAIDEALKGVVWTGYSISPKGAVSASGTTAEAYAAKEPPAARRSSSKVIDLAAELAKVGIELTADQLAKIGGELSAM